MCHYLSGAPLLEQTPSFFVCVLGKDCAPFIKLYDLFPPPHTHPMWENHQCLKNHNKSGQINPSLIRATVVTREIRALRKILSLVLQGFCILYPFPQSASSGRFVNGPLRETLCVMHWTLVVDRAHH